MDIGRMEAYLRVSVILLLILTCCLVGFDSETKVLYSLIVKKATFRDLYTYQVLVFIDSAAAAYNLLQIITKSCFLSNPSKVESKYPYRKTAGISLLLDQAVAYTVFAVNSAATEASAVGITGVGTFQWIKVCDKFTRFCIQIGGAMLCGYLASILMIILSSVSAFNLFRLYSPKKFLLLKPQ